MFAPKFSFIKYFIVEILEFYTNLETVNIFIATHSHSLIHEFIDIKFFFKSEYCESVSCSLFELVYF